VLNGMIHEIFFGALLRAIYFTNGMMSLGVNG
jgi:hypothetical protein